MGQPFRIGTVILEPVRDALQEAVARMPAVRVVDHTQMIDVEDTDGEPGQLVATTGQQPSQALTEQGALGQAGERIEVGQEVGGILPGEVLQGE